MRSSARFTKICSGGGETLPRQPARRNAQDQGALGGFRLRQEALEAEGHRPGPHRIDPFATVAARLYGAWSSTALLRLRVSAQEVAGCVALGARGETG